MVKGAAQRGSKAKKVEPINSTHTVELDDGEKVEISTRIVEDPEKKKAVTFFSKYKDDVILEKPSGFMRLGPETFVRTPNKPVNFVGRVHTTNDDTRISFLRDHRLYGKEVFEFGVPEHAELIKLYDDSGRITQLEKHSKLGRIAQRQWEIQQLGG